MSIKIHFVKKLQLVPNAAPKYITVSHPLPCGKHTVEYKHRVGQPMVFRTFCAECDPPIRIVASSVEVKEAGDKVMKKYEGALEGLK